MRTFFTLLFLAFSLAASAQQKPESKQEDKVTDLIARLPEVMKADSTVKAQSKNKRHLVTYIESRPVKGDDHYYLAVAEDNGISMVPHYHFAVDGKTYAISYYDVLNDKLTPLKTWRRMSSKKNVNILTIFPLGR